MTLNLDLTKFSKKELQDEIAICSDNLVFIEGKTREGVNAYNKLMAKRFIRPVKLASAKSTVDHYKLTSKINDKYSRLLLDESNRRSQLERNKAKEDGTK